MRRLLLALAGLLALALPLLAVPSQATPPIAPAAQGSAGTSVGPTAGHEAAAPQRKRKVSLKASPTTVPRGQKVTLKGKVRGGAYAKVTIWQRTVGRKWHVEATKYANRRGKFRHREDVRKGSRVYQACAKGACSRKVLVRMGKKKPTPPPPPPPTKVATSLTFGSLSATGVEAGQAFTVNGVGSPNLAGQTVFVHAYDAASSTWGAVGSGLVAGDGAFAISAAVSTAGKAVPLKLVFNGAPALLTSSADAGTVAVFGWYYLYDNGALDEVAGDWYESTFTVNGVAYSKSAGLYVSSVGSTDYGEVNLARSCSRFAATLGINDTSASTATRYSFRVIVDNQTVYNNGAVNFGTATPINVSIANGLRLRLEATRTAGSYDNGYLVMGDARALCAF